MRREREEVVPRTALIQRLDGRHQIPLQFARSEGNRKVVQLVRAGAGRLGLMVQPVLDDGEVFGPPGHLHGERRRRLSFLETNIVEERILDYVGQQLTDLCTIGSTGFNTATFFVPF